MTEETKTCFRQQLAWVPYSFQEWEKHNPDLTAKYRNCSGCNGKGWNHNPDNDTVTVACSTCNSARNTVRQLYEKQLQADREFLAKRARQYEQ
jgi:hypothetical protein